jgi:centrosomal protein CEP290
MQVYTFINEILDKDIADIATHQASDLVRLQAVNDKEKRILQAAIQELQMEGEEKLLIGKMHHHIVALQVSEATALRKIDILS